MCVLLRPKLVDQDIAHALGDRINDGAHGAAILLRLRVRLQLNQRADGHRAVPPRRRRVCSEDARGMDRVVVA